MCVCALLIPWCRHSPKYKGPQYSLRSYQDSFRNKACTKPRWMPSWELTYPTLGKGKSSAKSTFGKGYVSSQEGKLPQHQRLAQAKLKMFRSRKGPDAQLPFQPGSNCEWNDLAGLPSLRVWFKRTWFLMSAFSSQDFQTQGNVHGLGVTRSSTGQGFSYVLVLYWWDYGGQWPFLKPHVESGIKCFSSFMSELVQWLEAEHRPNHHRLRCHHFDLASSLIQTSQVVDHLQSANCKLVVWVGGLDS